MSRIKNRFRVKNWDGASADTYAAEKARWMEIWENSRKDIQVDMAINCLKMGLSIDFVISITGLTREAVTKLHGEFAPITVGDNVKTAFDFRYVAAGSDLHSQVVQLRHRVFFQPFGVPLQEVLDPLEEKSLHLVAARGELAIGYGRLTVDEGAAQVSQLVVEPALQKRGLGSELLRRLVERAGELGAATVFLHARLPYVPFYVRFGFIPAGDVFPSGRTSLPHQRMERPLP